MTYQEEIKRLNKIINYKNTALSRASALIEDLTADASYYIDRNDCLKRRISRLEAEKAELTGALNRAAYNPREDANWDSRPREESWEL